ncbi:MAG: helix-turn-helix domain-containing protein [Bryobacteraceae bacterium]|nr:helix-turn-helix domain-containing protein [Bryobacteraceae bacterium]
MNGAPMFPAVPQREKLLTPCEVAKWLGVSAGWVRDHATRKQPQIPVVRLGKLMRFRATEIEGFLREQGIR